MQESVQERLDLLVSEQHELNQLVDQQLPMLQAAWDARTTELFTELEHEGDQEVIKTTLNAAALEQLVAPPEGLNRNAMLRFISKANAIRSNALSSLYETLL